MTDKTASLTAALGAAIRRRREELALTQDDLARRVRENGLAWSRPAISSVESGYRALILSEVVIFLVALETDLATLLKGVGEVDLVDAEGPAVIGSELAHGLVEGPPRRIVRSGKGRSVSAARRRELEVARELGEMDYKAAARLRVEPLEVAATARRLYRRSLTDEREARLELRAPAPMTPKERTAIRGHVSRELYVELAEALERGD